MSDGNGRFLGMNRLGSFFFFAGGRGGCLARPWLWVESDPPGVAEILLLSGGRLGRPWAWVEPRVAEILLLFGGRSGRLGRLWIWVEPDPPGVAEILFV